MAHENQNSDPQNPPSQPTGEDLAFFTGDPADTGFSFDGGVEAALQQHTFEVSPKVADDLVAKYRAFQDALQPEAGVVYHPSSANDTPTSTTVA